MKRILSAAITLGLLMQPAACWAEAAEERDASAPSTAIAETALPAESGNVESDEIKTEPPLETHAPTAAGQETETKSETPAPTELPTEAPTEAPTESPIETPDASTSESPTNVPTQAPEPPTDDVVSVSDYAEIPDGAQAWLRSGENYLFGALSNVLKCAEESAEVYLHRAEAMEVKCASLQRLASLKLLPDQRVFGAGRYRAIVSKESPEQVEAPTEIDLTQWRAPSVDETADVFIWVAEELPEPTPAPSRQPEEIQIEVRCDDYRAGAWSGVHPLFALSGIPEGKSWAYAAVIYDERIAVLSGDSYLAEEEGVYTLRFVILDEMGDIADASEKYTLWLDHTPPEVSVYMDDAKDYTLHIDMADGMSGLAALSLDGGENWIELNGGASDGYTHTSSGKQRIAAGMLQVRDAAGNLWLSTEDYELTKLPSMGSGGGSGSDSTPAKQHAPEEDGAESGGEYNALEMQLPEEAMHSLQIDGRELALTLELANAEGFVIPDGYQPTFTAELTAWAVAEHTDNDGAQPTATDRRKDTLLLTAVSEENLGDRFEYRWKFNGEVYRLLANSGVRYLALQIGSDVAVFPTEGFVGGTKYTELKMLGVSTRKFDYTAAMRFDFDPDRIPKLSAWDFSESCDLAVQAEVENARYVLGDEQKGEMYCCNVYLGPTGMMNVPYGAYGA